MAEAQDLSDLAGFLNSPRADLRKVGAHAVLGLTGSVDGRAQLLQTDEVVRALTRIVGDVRSIARDALGALINLSADGDLTTIRLMLVCGVVEAVMTAVEDSECNARNRRLSVMLLANLTKLPTGALRLLQVDAADGILQGLYLRKLVHWFVKMPATEPAPPARNEDDGELKDPDAPDDWSTDQFQHVANVLTNVTQVDEGRMLLRERQLMLLPKLSVELASPNPGRRAGVAACIRNCAFEEFDHWWMLRDTALLTNLLLPLVGPEGFPADDQDGMDELLYSQGADKRREPDADVRRLIIETLLVFCLTREGRELLREKKVYPVVRDMHLAENNEAVEEEIYKLVDFLIQDEDGDAPDFDAAVRDATAGGGMAEAEAVRAPVSSAGDGSGEDDEDDEDLADLPPLED